MATIIGVLNVAPDSFSDGRTYTVGELRDRIRQLIHDGADIIDVGGEGTAPGSMPISSQEELRRLGVFFTIMGEFRNEVRFSLDTKKADIAKIGIDHGISIINDVSGGRNDTDMIPLLATHRHVQFIPMYCKNESGHADRDDSKNPTDIIETIFAFFDHTLPLLRAQGIEEEQIILDPGMGAFISTDPEDSIRVLRSIPEFKERYHLPILIGTSRKGFLGNISPDNGPHDRLASSLISSIFAIQQGVDYIRIHDVHEMRQAQKIWQSLHI